MARQLDTSNVDSRGRYLVVDPIFMEMLKDEDSRLLNADFGGQVYKMDCCRKHSRLPCTRFKQLPTDGTGPGTSGTTAQDDNFGIILAGQEEGVAMQSRSTK